MAVSNNRTAASFCSKLATAYSFSFTSTVFPICADLVCASTPTFLTSSPTCGAWIPEFAPVDPPPNPYAVFGKINIADSHSEDLTRTHAFARYISESADEMEANLRNLRICRRILPLPTLKDWNIDVFNELFKSSSPNFSVLGSGIDRFQNVLQHQFRRMACDLRAETELFCSVTSFLSPLSKPIISSIPFTDRQATLLESRSTQSASFPASMATIPDSSES